MKRKAIVIVSHEQSGSDEHGVEADPRNSRLAVARNSAPLRTQFSRGLLVAAVPALVGLRLFRRKKSTASRGCSSPNSLPFSNLKISSLLLGLGDRAGVAL